MLPEQYFVLAKWLHNDHWSSHCYRISSSYGDNNEARRGCAEWGWKERFCGGQTVSPILLHFVSGVHCGSDGILVTGLGDYALKIR
jgi:hypothetical protein